MLGQVDKAVGQQILELRSADGLGHDGEIVVVLLPFCGIAILRRTERWNGSGGNYRIVDGLLGPGSAVDAARWLMQCFVVRTQIFVPVLPSCM